MLQLYKHFQMLQPFFSKVFHLLLLLSNNNLDYFEPIQNKILLLHLHLQVRQEQEEFHVQLSIFVASIVVGPFAASTTMLALILCAFSAVI